MPNSDGNIGRVDAIELVSHSQAWTYRQRAPETAAMLPTGGGIVFSGSWDRYVQAFDDTTGKLLWQVRTNNAVNGFPITYMVNGKQYIALTVGNGGAQATTFPPLVPEIRNPPDRGAAIWVFELED